MSLGVLLVNLRFGTRHEPHRCMVVVQVVDPDTCNSETDRMSGTGQKPPPYPALGCLLLPGADIVRERAIF
jgi:hypothetical protein